MQPPLCQQTGPVDMLHGTNTLQITQATKQKKKNEKRSKTAKGMTCRRFKKVLGTPLATRVVAVIRVTSMAKHGLLGT